MRDKVRDSVGKPALAPADVARPKVAVIVPTYDHAHFLDHALGSIAAQTRPPDRVIVVDDGSHDDPGRIVAKYEGVEMLRQENSGLAAARNLGLAAAADVDFVVFLDADDALLPSGIELGLRCHAQNPGCGFVYGAHRRVDADFVPSGTPVYRPVDGSPYLALLEGNFIGSCATVMFDRAMLAACGGFDQQLARCEDYDAYFRLARRHPVCAHPGIVADYRIHAGNMSGNPLDMLEWATKVQSRYRPPPDDWAALAAFRRGRRNWRVVYANAVWRRPGDIAGKWAMSRRAPLASIVAAGASVLRKILPRRAYTSIRDLARRRDTRSVLRSLAASGSAEPISRNFGYDRGTPVDRWYIERFLAEKAGDIRGRVLEIGDDTYSRRFGRGISYQDVLHVVPDHPGATIVGDISQPGVLPPEAFDCLIVTQTLHLVYDMRAALENLRRSLAPGGVLLLTVPGVSSVDRGEWGGTWYWSLTRQSADRLLGEVFGPGNVETEAFGNVYAANCFLQGLAVEEVDQALLAHRDAAYPLVVCARARRAG